MARRFTLHFRLGDDGPLDDISGEFSDSEWTTLTDYVRFAEELASSEMIAAGHQVEAEIKWQREGETQFSWRVPPRPVIAEFLLLLRPLILQREPTHFGRIRNLLANRLDHTAARDLLAYCKYVYSDKPMQQQMLLSSRSGQLVNTEDMLNRWLDSEAYHRDPNKRQELNNLKLILPDQQLLVIFLSMLIDRSRAILELARLARIVVSGGDGHFDYHHLDA
jgi:hypothetical protein